MTAQRHYVKFLSPGTFVSEETEIEVPSWDVEFAMEKAHNIKERHGATPYGFQFLTREMSEADFEVKVVNISGTYFLGGEILTLKQVEERNDPNDYILLSNMRCNGYNKIIVNTNSWKATHPFGKDDILLDWKPRK